MPKTTRKIPPMSPEMHAKAPANIPVTETPQEWINSDDVTLLSVRQAAEYTGKKKAQITKAIIRGNLAAYTRTVHPDYPPLVEVTKADLDTWNAPKAPKIKAEHAGARATRGGQARRWLAYVPDSKIEAAKAAWAPLGLELTTAYRSKKDRAAANAEPNAETITANAAQIDEVDAANYAREHDLNSTPVENDAPVPASTSDELGLVEA